MTDRESFLADVLTIAIEHGIDYWAEGRNSEQLPLPDLRWVSIEIRDAEDPDAEWLKIDLAAIECAIQNIITEDDIEINRELRKTIAGASATNDACDIDCIHADAIVQIAAYGKIVFG